MRVVQRLLRPRRKAWPRLQSAVLRRQRRSPVVAAGVGRAQVRWPHGAQMRGWTLSHVIEQAAVRCSRQIDGSSPAGPQSASCRPARPPLGLGIPRASRSARTAVDSLRSPSALRVRAVVARPRRSRCRRRAAGFQSRSQAPDYSGTAMSQRVDVKTATSRSGWAHPAPTPRRLTGKEQYGFQNRKNQTRLGSA